jgi:hypothetical protein
LACAATVAIRSYNFSSDTEKSKAESDYSQLVPGTESGSPITNTYNVIDGCYIEVKSFDPAQPSIYMTYRVSTCDSTVKVEKFKKGYKPIHNHTDNYDENLTDLSADIQSKLKDIRDYPKAQ